MPANQEKPALQTPSSPRGGGGSSTSKYTNKDGSKFITVPKGSTSDSSQPSTPIASKANILPASPAPALDDVTVPTVNRKKQKRRQKAAAKAAAEQAANDCRSPSLDPGNPASLDYEIVPSDEDDVDYVLTEDIPPTAATNGDALDPKGKKNKRKKKKNASGHATVESQTPQMPAAGPAQGSSMSRDKIWSTSSHEERERIKEFWLGLGEDDRRSLVKVEKDAVLKKMKEQQKHTCSCTVCGRKRTAIEEELEGLYDAYYLELEQFANPGEGPPILPPREYPIRPPRGLPSGYPRQPPSRGRIVEHVGEDEEEELEEVYSEDEVEDDEYSDDEPPEDLHAPHERDVADFLTFGNSLQVKGGILTVADDLLKNDGKRFIEMMEQLAERRMAREEDAREHFSRGYGHPNGSYSNPHAHPPQEEEEYEEEEDEEEDYEDSQDEEYEEDEEDQMTEEQRMEEGRRMFQIFAARMFEQRVLTAYKEKVANERQQQLLDELEEESRQVDEQKARRAKNAQKKKDKAAQKKQAVAEEKARKEAEKQAEEEARREAEQKQRAEQKLKSEAKRKEKEAQRKAEEDLRVKREAERQRRLQEQKEKQAEQERKAREARDRERKLKEEQRLKEARAREQREREAQERKEKQERDKQEKEARAAKALKEAQARQAAAAEAREREKEQQAIRAERERAQRAQDKAAPKAPTQQAQPQVQILQSPARRSQQQHQHQHQQHPVSLPAAAALPQPQQQQQHAANPTRLVSPKIPVATPAIAKAPTPIRPRTTSIQQETGRQASSSSSSHSQPGLAPCQSASPHSAAQVFAGPGPAAQERKVSGSCVVAAATPPTSLSVTPPRAPSKGPSSSSTPYQAPPMGMQPPPGLVHHHHHHHPPLQPPPPPGFPSRMNLEPIYPLGFRPSPSPNMMPAPPPGINGHPGRGYAPVTMPPPGFSHPAVTSGDNFPTNQGFPLSKEGSLPSLPSLPNLPSVPPHRRQSSLGFDSLPPGISAQPIGRPAPIGRPGSIAGGRVSDGIEDTPHLGSRALLEDDDELSGLDPGSASLRSQSLAARSNFAPSPFLDAAFPLNPNPWGPPSTGASQLFPPPGFGTPAWGVPMAPPSFHVGSPTSGMGAIRAPAQPRHVYLRLMLCHACKDLTFASADAEGYVDLGAVKSHIDALSGDASITDQDLLNLCDTEGSNTNGGGTFDVLRDGSGPGKHSIRWVPEPKDGITPQFRAVGAPGEIGSPLVGHAALRGI